MTRKFKGSIKLEPSSSAPTSPEEGDMYYDQTSGLLLYDGSDWVNVGNIKIYSASITDDTEYRNDGNYVEKMSFDFVPGESPCHILSVEIDTKAYAEDSGAPARIKVTVDDGVSKDASGNSEITVIEFTTDDNAGNYSQYIINSKGVPINFDSDTTSTGITNRVCMWPKSTASYTIKVYLGSNAGGAAYEGLMKETTITVTYIIGGVVKSGVLSVT